MQPRIDQADAAAAERTSAAADDQPDVVAAERVLVAAEAFGAASATTARCRAQARVTAEQVAPAAARASKDAAAASEDAGAPLPVPGIRCRVVGGRSCGVCVGRAAFIAPALVPSLRGAVVEARAPDEISSLEVVRGGSRGLVRRDGATGVTLCDDPQLRAVNLVSYRRRHLLRSAGGAISILLYPRTGLPIKSVLVGTHVC